MISLLVLALLLIIVIAVIFSAGILVAMRHDSCAHTLDDGDRSKADDSNAPQA